METPFHTSPSAISRYFFHDCERFFRYTASGAAQRKLDDVPTGAFDQSPLMKAILESGYTWEHLVLKKHLNGHVKIASGKGEIHTRRFDRAATVDLLRTVKPGEFVYQPTFRAPRKFYERYAIDRQLITISENHPDLIAVLPDDRKGRLLRVLDVKRGHPLKMTHRVQILLYAMELADILAEEGIANAKVDLAQGGVWLGGQCEPTLFDLGHFRPHLETFLRDDLMRILGTDMKDVNWHVYSRCEWCEYFDHCRAEIGTADDISRLAHLSTYGKRHLVKEAGVRTIRELGEFLVRDDADRVLGQCASLAGRRPILLNQVRALANREAEVHDASSPALPRGENLKLFLTLQDEPLGCSIYLAGVYLQGKKETLEEVFSEDMLTEMRGVKGSLQPLVLLAETPDQVEKLQANWIQFVYTLFAQLDAYNKGLDEWSGQLSLQTYVHSEREKTLLVSCLMDALSKPKLTKEAMTLLFHIQAPELISAEEHPNQELAFPVVVLMHALGRLLALPIDINYTLPEALVVLGSRFQYRRSGFFHFPLGHGLRAEAIHAAWYGGKREMIGQIAKQASLHLYAIASLLQGIRDKAGHRLFAWPPKFVLPMADDAADPLLSRLIFFVRYDSLLRCVKLRDARCLSRETQVLQGTTLELVAQNESVMDVVGDAVMEVEGSDFPGFLLVRDNEIGRQSQLEYQDYYYRNSNSYKIRHHAARAIVSVDDVDQDGNGPPAQIAVSYRTTFSEGKPVAGERFLLYERYQDYNTDRVIAFLKDYVTRDSLFLRILKNSEVATTKHPLPKNVEKAASEGERALCLTSSQCEAYQRIRRQKLVPVWGPPGTGKTHFLASVILGMTEAYARSGRAFRVLVTAFTHAAIENVLRKTAELQRSRGLTHGIQLGKAKYWQGPNTKTAEVVEEDGIPAWLAGREHAVLGATVYSCLRKFQRTAPYDLVIIDEASQLRVAESAIPIGLVADGGRLVLAGDHLQLPPIVAGVYPEPQPGEPILHRSIFEAVCPATQNGGGLLCQLTENFRMNDVLTSYAATLLYGPNYKCFSNAIATRRLNLKKPRHADALVKACLDPDHPLVIVVLEGVRAAKENLIEAELVAKLTHGLRSGLRSGDGRTYRDDGEFFQQGLFIVCPHRAQIRAIQRKLREVRKWDHTPFVDTVDKMQGQEAEAVIVSYGVADPEYAMQEANFIYGLNRLNVAITRAKTKCVVCLPRPLLDATPQVLDEPEAARGLAFMRDIVSQVEMSGEKLVFNCGNNVRAVVYRGGRCV